MVAKTIVFDELPDWDFTEHSVADYSAVINGSEVSFTNTSSSFDTVLWSFGDSNTSTESNPVHIYTESGRYDVSLTISACGNSNTKTKTIDVTLLSIKDFYSEPINIYPNPTSGKIILTTSANNLDELTLDLSSLGKGIYILNITTNNRSYIEK